MGCILTISGENFDVDAFVEKSSIKDFRKGYKGESINKVSTRIRQFSMASIEISDADFGDMKTQIEEATAFLTKHRDNLKHIATTTGIDYAGIDFGTDSTIDNDHLTQSFYFTKQLVQICAELGLEIALSLYKPDMQLILEEKRVKRTENR